MASIHFSKDTLRKLRQQDINALSLPSFDRTYSIHISYYDFDIFV